MTHQVRYVKVAYPPSVGQNSIAEHGDQLVRAIREFSGAMADTTDLDVLRSDVSGPDTTVLLQYNPFAYGRWGFAPQLVARIHRLTRRRVRPRIVLVLHEPYVPFVPDRSMATAAWQRLQLLALTRSCDATIAVTAAWKRRAERLVRGTRPVHNVPVGSNVPDKRAERQHARDTLGVDERTVVVAQFGTNHPSRLNDHTRVTVEQLERSGVPAVLLNLGHQARPVAADCATREVLPGYLQLEGLAALLSAADVFLSPCIDGVSTRRTSIMAALQHGVPVVGTFTPDTDDSLREGPAVRLAPVHDVQRFAQLAVALASSRDELDRSAIAARALFEREFAWSVIAARFLHVLRSE